MKRSFLLIVICCVHTAFSQSARPVGANLTDLSPFSTLWAYTNALKQSSGWLVTNATDNSDPIKQSSELRMELAEAFDANGYPNQVPFEFDHPDTQGKVLEVSCLVLNGQPSPYFYPSGDYLLVFEGQGTITIQGDVDGDARDYTQPGEHMVPISNPTSLGLEIFIKSSSLSDPVRNVQLIFPEYINTYNEQKFRSDFIELIQHFRVLRFMKPLRVENNIIENWEDRTLTSSFSYFLDVENAILLGMPYEDVIELSNLAMIDPWICVPHRANDAYVTNLANMFHSGLNSSRKLYLEYANEGWNPSYPVQRQYMLEQGNALNLATSTHPELAELEAVHRFLARRSLEVFEIFDNVYADDSRVISIHGTQSDPFVADLTFESYDLASVNPNGILPDAIAPAAYIGVTLFDDLAANQIDVCGHTPQQLLDTVRARVQKEMIEFLQRFSELAQARDIELYAYEGGQHVTEINFQPMSACAQTLVTEMNRLPGMQDFFCDLFEVWFETLGGSQIMVFNLAERPDAFGAFGILESQWQSGTESPKWQGVSTCGFGYNSNPVGINANNRDLLLYPNPASHNALVRVEGVSDGGFVIEVFTLTGNKVYSRNVGASANGLYTLDEYLPRGTYLVRVASDHRTFQGKLHVRH